MYLLAVLCATLIVVSSEREIVKIPAAVATRLEPIVKKCEAEIKPPANAYEKVLAGVMDDDITLNFGYCFALAAGHITDDGHANVNKILSIVKEGELKEQFKKSLENCNKATGKDPKEVLRAVAACYQQNSPIQFTL